ncbi:NAD-dependent epimerase/dehydratase family protein [Paenibacillus wynnii]|uniref:NAD-dependent epimerase/dehydratase domain-containing protein n=1 Tax=Paenibacillus wynnii TaxID=268407 RepID=A0A098MDT1_9BACL|nr:NAD(P)-dependent oxidoreductase [Paenibacillus wynnii]KGE20724.1 hypothetical protein PWYN_00635 [Paenibacillus wynnii]
MSRRRILITGAAGFTGRHAVNYFAAQGAEVIAVLRNPVAMKSPAFDFPQGIQTYVCDLSDRKAVAEMIKTVIPEDVLHLAGKNSVPESWQNPLLYMETNVMATLYLLEALRILPSCRILVAGSRLKYRIGAVLPPHPYSLSKTLEELVSLAWRTLFQQQVLLAEPCNLMGPGSSTGFCSLLAGHIARSENGVQQAPFKVSSRSALRDFLDVRDAVRAYEYILDKGANGTIYRIESGKERKLGDIAEQLLKLTQAAVPMVWGSETAEKPVVYSEPPFTPEEEATALGWSADISFEQSLSDIMDYFRVGREGGWA